MQDLEITPNRPTEGNSITEKETLKEEIENDKRFNKTFIYNDHGHSVIRAKWGVGQLPWIKE